MSERIERIVFFGTPEFAVPSLEALVAADRAPVRVVTQPARPAGRGRALREPAVGVTAKRLGLDVQAVSSVRTPEFLDELRGLEPDLGVVVAFGQIFPPELLALPGGGCINVHASLLPSFRGASPVQAAILSGAVETGVTTMVMDEGLDTGPILLQRGTPIGERETAGELAERLARLGAELLVETIDGLEAGSVRPLPQDEETASVAPRLRKEDGRLDWSRPAGEIFRRLRALTPWPGVVTRVRTEPVRVVWGEPVASGGEELPPGAYAGFREGRIEVACGQGSRFGIEHLQRPGRRATTATDFLNAIRLEVGERLG